MDDAFDRLAETELPFRAPSSDAIRIRARKIQKKRRGAWGGLAAVALIAASAQLFSIPQESSEVATPERVNEATGRSNAERNPRKAQVAPSVADASPVPSQSQEGKRASSRRDFGSSASELPPPGPLSAQLETSSSPASPANPSLLRLKICNSDPRPVSVVFPTSQRYDFEVQDSAGTLVWRWGADRQFANVRTTERIEPGCRVIGEENWDGRDQRGIPVSPGPYQVIGIVKSQTALRSQPVTVCAFTC